MIRRLAVLTAIVASWASPSLAQNFDYRGIRLGMTTGEALDAARVIAPEARLESGHVRAGAAGCGLYSPVPCRRLDVSIADGTVTRIEAYEISALADNSVEEVESRARAKYGQEAERALTLSGETVLAWGSAVADGLIGESGGPGQGVRLILSPRKEQGEMRAFVVIERVRQSVSKTMPQSKPTVLRHGGRIVF